MNRIPTGDIYRFARGAGFSAAAAVTATAVALAESTGDADAHCLNCVPGVTEDSRGLWQINVDAHPQYSGWNLYDPATNARAAYQVSGGGKSFSPWTTYTSGSYANHLGAAGAAAGGAPITGPTQTGGGSSSGAAGGVQTVGLNANVFDGFGIPGTIADAAKKDLLKVTIEAVLITGGAALVVVGLYRAVQPAVNKVANVAGDAAKVAAL